MGNPNVQIPTQVTFDVDLVQSAEVSQETVLVELRDVSFNKVGAALEIMQPGQFLRISQH